MGAEIFITSLHYSNSQEPDNMKENVITFTAFTAKRPYNYRKIEHSIDF